MSVKVRVPTQLRTLTGGAGEVTLDGSTVGEVLVELEVAHPGVGERIFDGDGQLRRFVNVFLADEDVRFLKGLDTPVDPGQTISIVPAVAGGTSPPNARMTAADRRGMEILVVDDDRDIRSLLTFTLEDAGYRTREAPDGAAAIAALREQAPHCVVLDVMMPGVDGFEVLSARQRFGFAPSSRVVLLTAKTAEPDFVRGWELGADDYVTKPFEPDELVDAVDVVLAATPIQLEQRRRAELEKAAMLNQLDTAFRSRRPLSR